MKAHRASATDRSGRAGHGHRASTPPGVGSRPRRPTGCRRARGPRRRRRRPPRSSRTCCRRPCAPTPPQTVPVRILLVDSGSTEENHAAAVAMLPPGSDVVRMGRNGGFGPSANAGWRRFLAAHDGEWVGLSPHDALPAPDAVERILRAVAEPAPSRVRLRRLRRRLHAGGRPVLRQHPGAGRGRGGVGAGRLPARHAAARPARCARGRRALRRALLRLLRGGRPRPAGPRRRLGGGPGPRRPVSTTRTCRTHDRSSTT